MCCLQAKTVSAATNSLCEAANAVVEGGATEERLIASSKAVAKATAQLLVSCMIKADPTGSSIKRLQVCTTYACHGHSRVGAPGGGTLSPRISP